MVAVDTSSWIAFFADDPGGDVEALQEALSLKCAVNPPVVLSELFSDPNIKGEIGELLLQIPSFEVKSGYWMRAGLSRAKLVNRRLKARLADTLIAQYCIDYGIPLITRDKDFRHFAKYCGLRLLSSPIR